MGSVITCKFALEPELCHVCGDATQLELAVLDPVINVRYAIPEGGTLRIAIQGVTLDGGDIDLAAGAYVELSVADTGSGMPPEVVARAMEPLFTTKHVGAGTGLGWAQHGARRGDPIERDSVPAFDRGRRNLRHVPFAVRVLEPGTASMVMRGNPALSDDLSGPRITPPTH